MDELTRRTVAYKKELHKAAKEAERAAKSMDKIGSAKAKEAVKDAKRKRAAAKLSREMALAADVEASRVKIREQQRVADLNKSLNATRKLAAAQKKLTAASVTGVRPLITNTNKASASMSRLRRIAQNTARTLRGPFTSAAVTSMNATKRKVSTLKRLAQAYSKATHEAHRLIRAKQKEAVAGGGAGAAGGAAGAAAAGGAGSRAGAAAAGAAAGGRLFGSLRGAAGMLGVGLGTAQVVRMTYRSAQDVQQADAYLERTLGVDSRKAQEAEEALDNLVRQVPKTHETLAGAITAASVLTDFKGQDLDRFMSSAAKLSILAGEDTSRLAQGLAQAFNSFHVDDIEDALASMDVIYGLVQKYRLEIYPMLRSFGRVGAAFRGQELTLPQTANIFAQLTQHGVNVEQINEPMRQMIVNAAKRGVAPQVALQTAIGEIAAAPTDAEANRLGSEWFGTEGGHVFVEGARVHRHPALHDPRSPIFPAGIEPPSIEESFNKTLTDREWVKIQYNKVKENVFSGLYEHVLSMIRDPGGKSRVKYVDDMSWSDRLKNIARDIGFPPGGGKIREKTDEMKRQEARIAALHKEADAWEQVTKWRKRAAETFRDLGRSFTAPTERMNEAVKKMNEITAALEEAKRDKLRGFANIDPEFALDMQLRTWNIELDRLEASKGPAWLTEHAIAGVKIQIEGLNEQLKQLAEAPRNAEIARLSGIVSAGGVTDHVGVVAALRAQHQTAFDYVPTGDTEMDRLARLAWKSATGQLRNAEMAQLVAAFNPPEQLPDPTPLLGTAGQDTTASYDERIAELIKQRDKLDEGFKDSSYFQREQLQRARGAATTQIEALRTARQKAADDELASRTAQLEGIIAGGSTTGPQQQLVFLRSQLFNLEKEFDSLDQRAPHKSHVGRAITATNEQIVALLESINGSLEGGLQIWLDGDLYDRVAQGPIAGRARGSC